MHWTCSPSVCKSSMVELKWFWGTLNQNDWLKSREFANTYGFTMYMLEYRRTIMMLYWWIYLIETTRQCKELFRYSTMIRLGHLIYMQRTLVAEYSNFGVYLNVNKRARWSFGSQICNIGRIKCIESVLQVFVSHL